MCSHTSSEQRPGDNDRLPTLPMRAFFSGRKKQTRRRFYGVERGVAGAHRDAVVLKDLSYLTLAELKGLKRHPIQKQGKFHLVLSCAEPAGAPGRLALVLCITATWLVLGF